MLSLKQLALLITVTVGGIAAAYLINASLAIGFLPGLILLTAMTRRLGFGLLQIARAMLAGVARTKEVMWTLALVGLIIPAWMASGTIPLMIQTGLTLLSPQFFLACAFLLTGVISMTLGTCMGSLSSIGIPLIGMAAVTGIPLPLAAGAVVSGAMVGDRTSPFSSANRLVASSVGISDRENLAALAPTTIAAGGAALLGFAALDLNGGWDASGEGASMFVATGFRFGWTLFLPPLLLVASILLRLSTQVAFITAIAAATVLGTGYQDIPLDDWGRYLLFGYDAGVAGLKTKGLAGMAELIVFIAMAGAFNGIMAKTKSIQGYIRTVFGASRSLAVTTLRAVVYCLLVSALACNQTLPIMIAGGSLGEVWKERFAPTDLARIVADSAVVFPILIPWNLMAILCGSILQVEVVSYLPYAIFLWTLPLFTWAVSALKKNRQSLTPLTLPLPRKI